MAKKSIIAGEYILQIADNGHVDVVRIFRNAKQHLREIAAAHNYAIEEKWNTQVLGRHIVTEFGDGKTAKFDDVTINRLDNNHIEIYQECKNTKEALRTISEQLGFEYDREWNTQQFGAKLVKYLEEHKAEADKVLRTKNAKRKEEAPAAAEEAPAESTTLIAHILEDFLVTDSDFNYLYESMLLDDDEKTLFVDYLHAQNMPEENETLDKLAYTGSEDFSAYLAEDPDDLNLAYKIICAAYALYNGYDLTDEDTCFAAEEQWYRLEDGMGLSYDIKMDIDFG